MGEERETIGILAAIEETYEKFIVEAEKTTKVSAKRARSHSMTLRNLLKDYKVASVKEGKK